MERVFLASCQMQQKKERHPDLTRRTTPERLASIG
jgi:hypothetical protein